MNISHLKEDQDVVGPFLDRLLMRIREKHPNVTLEDISIYVEINIRDSIIGDMDAATRIRRMLRDMDKEGIKL